MTGKREEGKMDNAYSADEATPVRSRISRKRVVIKDDGRYVIFYEFAGVSRAAEW